MRTHVFYLILLATLAMLVASTEVRASREAIVVIGAIGLWRYGWAAINFARAIWFRRVAYPRRKAIAHQKYAERQIHARAHFLVTSYKIPNEVSVKVYRSVFAAAKRSEGPAQVVASVVELSDVMLIQTLYQQLVGTDDQVELIIDRIPGTGKRDALAAGLRQIAKSCPTENDVLVVVDGDTCVPEDVVEQSAPFFTNPLVGALTTDERAEIAVPGLFRDWFQLRFDQRQVMMCSMGLSNRVLTLTGRMSVFRADIATHAEFIRAVQNDHIDHWRFGRLKFLTGDDKSTWFWLLKHGYEMAYLPDVQSVAMESQPDRHFLKSAVTLMSRWFGNMLRTNSRALALPSRRIGRFVWWSILDQRLSIWTTLSGPLTAIMAAIFFDPMILAAYLVWVLFTRYLFCVAICAFRGRSFPLSFPVLLYFSQLMGALVKSYVTFRLDRQRWTRQSTRINASNLRVLKGLTRGLSSAYLHVVTIGYLLIGVFYLVNGV